MQLECHVFDIFPEEAGTAQSMHRIAGTDMWADVTESEAYRVHKALGLLSKCIYTIRQAPESAQHWKEVDQ